MSNNLTQSEKALIFSFVAGFFCYIAFIPFYRSRKSFFDAVSARRITSLLRILIMLEVLSCTALLYFVISFGSPIPVPYTASSLPYGKGNANSWLFSFPRPISGFVFIGAGVFGDMHPLPRIICILGSFFQSVCDGLSYVAVDDYFTQHTDHNAPFHGNFNDVAMKIYIYRDLLSLAICTWVLLLAGHLSCVIGWCEPQLISYQVIAGGHHNRCQIMRDQLDKRNQLTSIRGTEHTKRGEYKHAVVKSDQGIGSGSNFGHDSV